jgi:hypothetical protein
MSDEELLKRKILEFELELKKNHIDYGLPVVEVIEGDVVFCKDFVKTFTVTDITFVEFNILARNFFDTFYTFALAVTEIIEYNGVITCFKELNAGV